MTEPISPPGQHTDRILVAGIGNIFLGDDGFGPAVTRRLVGPVARPDVRIVDYGIRGMHLAYDLLDGYRALVIIDLIPRGEPGQVQILQVDREDLAGGSFDAHGMDPAAVLGTLEALGGTLPTTYVVGCRPVTLDEQLELSEPVAAAVEQAVEAVTRLLAGPLSPAALDRPSADSALAGQSSASARSRRRFAVRGVVQGIGFRPFVYALARQLGLSGAVSNTADGVLIEVEGTAGAVAEFGARLPAEAPALAVLTEISQSAVPVRGGTEFTIAASSGGPGHTFVSPDLASCPDCLAELADPADRRYRYPFITCTNCGPRFTIITGLPYDRPATTMAGFPLCERCAAEYADPADRRFHAQPIGCADCGPTLRFTEASGLTEAARFAGGPLTEDVTGESALSRARQLLAAGAVLAVKGLGGYHLACDAGNDTAVGTLRKRKDRGDKPFAVMVADLADGRRTGRDQRAGRRAALWRPPADRAAAAPGRLAGRRGGGAEQPGSRGDAGLHPAAPAAARRPAAGDDQWQPQWRADRHR